MNHTPARTLLARPAASAARLDRGAARLAGAPSPAASPRSARRARARPGRAEDPHRLLAGRRRPAVLRRDREGLLQGGRPRRRAAQVRRRAAGDGGDARRAAPTAAPTAPARPTSRSARSRSRASSRSSRPTRATRSTCSRSSSCRRTARSSRWPSSRASASPPGPGIQNVTLAKTMLERAGAGVHDRHRAADRPARRGAGRRPDRRRLHARADRHRRPHERHDARARGRRRRPLHPGRPDGAVARRLGQPHHRVHQEVPGRGEEVHRRLRRAASSWCAASPTRRAST